MKIYLVSLTINQEFGKLKWMMIPFHRLLSATLKDISNGQ